MSFGIQVFIATDMEIDELANELNVLLDISLEDGYTDSDRWFFAHLRGIELDLLTADSNRGIVDGVDLRDFKYFVRLVSLIRKEELREQRVHEYADLVFERLRTQSKFRIVIIGDKTTKLAEYNPE